MNCCDMWKGWVVEFKSKRQPLVDIRQAMLSLHIIYCPTCGSKFEYGGEE